MTRSARTPVDIVLVGLVLPDVQNHSLSRLAHAAAAAGFAAEIVPFAGFPDIDRVVAAVLSGRPLICGVSIQTSEAALASVTLLEMLRLRGYRGQIVVGGHFATLNADDLVREIGAIDVVVRFAGEPAIQALLRMGATRRDAGDVAPGDGAALAEIPGIVFRDAGGATTRGAPPVVDMAPVNPLPLDLTPSVHLGFPAADLVGSRGCEAHCSYCCVAAASDAAERGGDPRYRRQGTEDLADEIARLYHQGGVRVLNFMDDNLLPLQPDAAAEWISTMSRALRTRDVGRLAFSLQLRADVCSEAVVTGLVDLGLVRAYVGIDGYSGRQLVALGRDAPSSAGPVALERLAAAGVFTVCNALLLGPTFGFSSLGDEVDALARVRHAPVHLLPIDVRRGTTYFERVRRRGLLEGGMLLRRYRFEDPRTALLAEAVTGLPTRLEEYSVPIALYDLGYNLGIARRLLPQADVSAAVETYRDVTRRWNVDQIRVLRAAISAAETLDRAKIVTFVAGERDRVRALDDQLRAACVQAMRAVERCASDAGGKQVKVHRRGHLLSGVALSMMLGACGNRPFTSSRIDGGGLESNGASDALVVDRLTLDDRFTINLDAFGGGGDMDALSSMCGDGGRTPATYNETLPTSASCCSTRVNEAQVTFDSAGIPIAVSLPDAGANADALMECVLRALGNYCFPSAAGTTQPLVNSHCWIA